MSARSDRLFYEEKRKRVGFYVCKKCYVILRGCFFPFEEKETLCFSVCWRRFMSSNYDFALFIDQRSGIKGAFFPFREESFGILTALLLYLQK